VAPFERECPLCGFPAMKAMYLGLPLRLCVREACSGAWGLGADAAVWCPVTTEDDDGEPSWKFVTYRGPWVLAAARWAVLGERGWHA
jgi:hypothetical protein